MKNVVSVSLGSSKRDHQVQVDMLGESFQIGRLGTDGDFKKALRKLQELDGQVDAIGLGGIDVFVYASGKKYAFRDGLKMMRAVQRTPVVDGSGLKNTLERETINYLLQNNLIKPKSRVLMVSAVDRFGMAEAFVQGECDVTFGDLIFAAGINHPIKNLAKLNRLAARLLPIYTKLPFQMLYPTGKKQEVRHEGKAQKYAGYYQEADVIAGDLHYIKRYLPDELNGQIIVTNTTTTADVNLLKERGASLLVTTTPAFNGRSFGTNVLEAVMVAILAKPWAEVTEQEYFDLVAALDFKPGLTNL